MPLHTDYRPKTLEEVAGNKDLIEQLNLHLQKKNPNRSLMFIGPSGCGKTTLAECVAKAVIEDDMVNFTALNASDFRGIDTVREVREAAFRKPLGKGKVRVWLWDECHKISPDGQEAMLKLLEDPPTRCWFILATTNPEKLKETLKRRVTTFEVKPLTDRELSTLLFRTCKQEGKKIPTEVINAIIKECNGSPGIALNILDKVIDLPEVKMAAAAVKLAEKASNVIFLGRTIQELRKKKFPSGSWGKVICPILKEFEEEDAETVRRQTLEYFRKICLSGDESAYVTMTCFAKPYYDTGKAGLVMSVYEALCQE